MKQFTKTINGIKYQGKAFTKEDVIEKLGRTKEEWNLIDQYQKSFPQLLMDETSDFVIDGKQLWVELGEPQGRFNMFASRKIVDMFEENYDYICLAQASATQRNDGQKGETSFNNYTLTLDVAKQLALGVGTTKSSSIDVREKGKLVRKYFILIEKMLKDMDKWNETREPEKSAYNEMDKAIDEWGIRNEIPNVNRFLQKRECNMLNLSLLGFKADEIQAMIKCKDNITRDHLKEEYNKALTKLQEASILLMESDVKFSEREKHIQTLCKNKYSIIKEDFKLHIKNINK